VKRIVADPARCMACRSCELACAQVHAGTDDVLEATMIRGAKPCVYIELAAGLAVPLQCRHCDDAPCVRVCPSGALWRASPNEPVLVEQDRCFGCGFCVEACPFGVVRLTTAAVGDVQAQRRVVLKCDLCNERRKAGLQPACVSACPTKALRLEDVDQRARDARRRTAAQLAAASEQPS